MDRKHWGLTPNRHSDDETSAKIAAEISARDVIELEGVRNTMALDSTDRIRQGDDQADNDSSDIE